MGKITRVILIIVLLLLLVALRGYFESFFYDPFIKYFKTSFLTKSIPPLHFTIYFFNVFLRYFINTAISLLVIYLIFLNEKYIAFALKFYGIAFVVLSVLLYVLLKIDTPNIMLLFYVRRFLMQPLFLFVLVFAFYYYKHNNN